MFPIAGVVIWIALGGLIGWLASKVTDAESHTWVMANMGVGMVAAVVAGFIVAFVMKGDRSLDAFWAGIWIAAVSAAIAVMLVHAISPRRPRTIR